MQAKIAKRRPPKDRLKAWFFAGAMSTLAIAGIFAWMLTACFMPLRGGFTDTFFLRDASLRNPEYLYVLDARLTAENAFNVLHDTPSVYAHRLKRGTGIIFGYRWYFDKYPHAIDDEEFEKITIWLPAIPKETVSTVDLSDGTSVIAVYTKGGSAWPADACSGFLNAGHLEIRKTDNWFVVTLEGTLSPTALPIFPDLCKPTTVAINFEATELQYHELTTWLGKPGRHPYDETYRDEALR